jgi:hypothetical protein
MITLVWLYILLLCLTVRLVVAVKINYHHNAAILAQPHMLRAQLQHYRVYAYLQPLTVGVLVLAAAFAFWSTDGALVRATIDGAIALVDIYYFVILLVCDYRRSPAYR